MLHAGPADWTSCFYFPTATPNSKWVLETECPHPTLTPARRQDRTSDPGPVTEPFCPPAGKGSLGPESHWGSVAKEKNRAASTLRDVSPSTRPREGSGKCHPESREEKPPSPHHDLGDPIYGHVWKSGLGQHSDTWTADLGQQNAQPTVGTPRLGATLEGYVTGLSIDISNTVASHGMTAQIIQWHAQNRSRGRMARAGVSPWARGERCGAGLAPTVSIHRLTPGYCASLACLPPSCLQPALQ